MFVRGDYFGLVLFAFKAGAYLSRAQIAWFKHLSSFSHTISDKEKVLYIDTSGLYYKHIRILNYDSSMVNKFGASLTDDARVVIYDRHMFIVQATSYLIGLKDISFLYRILEAHPLRGVAVVKHG